MTPPPRPLSRTAGDGRPVAPVRIAHLGLGGFFRAHQAWYTEHAPDADGWGIAAFAGRSAGLAAALRAQDGLYTLVTRGPTDDATEVVASVSAAHPADDAGAWARVLSSPDLAVVTLTVTEAGYSAGVPGRLVDGLLARARADAGPLAVVPCDNLPGNGEVVARAVTASAESVDPGLAAWIAGQVSFVTTMVDRITPRATDADRAAVAAGTGRQDRAPVVTEPFTEWVLHGDFPAGRPGWEAAGARFVADVGPFEQRKLWLLNGAHSLLAYAGGLRGHETVADAVADPECRRWVEQWWDEAARHLALPAAEVDAYRAALLDRFANPRMRHLLAQVAADGSEKLPVRVVPVLRAERSAGRLPRAAARVVAAWVCHLRGAGAPVDDPRPDLVRRVHDASLDEAAREALEHLGPDLADDAELRATVVEEARALRG